MLRFFNICYVLDNILYCSDQFITKIICFPYSKRLGAIPTIELVGNIIYGLNWTIIFTLTFVSTNKIHI